MKLSNKLYNKNQEDEDGGMEKPNKATLARLLPLIEKIYTLRRRSIKMNLTEVWMCTFWHYSLLETSAVNIDTNATELSFIQQRLHGMSTTFGLRYNCRVSEAFKITTSDVDSRASCPNTPAVPSADKGDNSCHQERASTSDNSCLTCMY
nr:hypothetical protein [Tanacetum cinerariifolium]